MVLLDDITKRDSLLNDSYGSSRLCCVGVVGFVGFMVKAGKARSFSCKTTVALSWRREQIWHRGKRAWQWRCEQKWLLVTVQSLFPSVATHPPFLPPPHASLMLFIWCSLSKCKIVRISEVTNCFISVWNSHRSLQDLETRTLLQFRKKFSVEVALLCLHIEGPERALWSC